MRTCLLHIGMPKTGSTSIQEAANALPDQGPFRVIRPEVANSANMSGIMLVGFGPGRPVRSRRAQERTMLTERIRPRSEGAKNHLAKAFDTLPTDCKALMSGEAAVHLSETELVSMRDFLGDHFDSIEVYGYVRSPKGSMESSFQERVKGGMDRVFLPGLWPQYRKKFEKFDEVFGRDRVNLRSFSQSVKQTGCIVTDFFTWIGYPTELEKPPRSNQSLSLPAVSLLFIRNVFSRSGESSFRGSFKRSLTERMSLLEGPRMTFAPPLVQEMIDGNQDDMAWITSRLGNPFHEDFVAHSTDISTSDDLLRCPAAGVEWLHHQLPNSHAHRLPSAPIPESIAECMDIWISTLDLDSQPRRRTGPRRG